MNAQEPIDMTKWAIAILVFCLLLGTCIFMFYMLYDKTDERVDSMQKAATSSNMDRLYDLQDETLSHQGDIKHYPLCSNVVSALTEFDEADLLYIAVRAPGADSSLVFTYEDVTLSPQSGETVFNSQTPVTDACKYLLSYSNCRTEVVLGKYDIDSNSTNPRSTNLNDPGLMYIMLILYTDPIVE